MNLSEIKLVDICYENCEVFSIESSLVNYIRLTDVKTKYDISYFPFKRYKTVSSLEISISSDSNKVGMLWMEEDREPFERTNCYDDIVYFDIEYLDGTKEKIYAPWDGDDYTNKNQSSRLDEKGNLLIKIERMNES